MALRDCFACFARLFLKSALLRNTAQALEPDPAGCKAKSAAYQLYDHRHGA